MTSGAAGPSSLLSHATTNCPVASPTETRGAAVTGADPGSRPLPSDQSAAEQGDQGTCCVRAVGHREREIGDHGSRAQELTAFGPAGSLPSAEAPQ